MAENYTIYDKAAIFDRLYSYFTDPMGRNDSPAELTIDELRVENAKLRELVRGLNWCTEGPDGPRVDCEHCPLGAVDGEPLELMCEKMMRELGVEAPDV